MPWKRVCTRMYLLVDDDTICCPMFCMIQPLASQCSSPACGVTFLYTYMYTCKKIYIPPSICGRGALSTVVLNRVCFIFLICLLFPFPIIVVVAAIIIIVGVVVVVIVEVEVASIIRPPRHINVLLMFLTRIDVLSLSLSLSLSCCGVFVAWWLCCVDAAAAAVAAAAADGAGAANAADAAIAMRCIPLHLTLPQYPTSLHYVALHCTPLYSTLLYSTPLCSTLLCSALVCSTLLYSTLLYSILFYSTLVCSVQCVRVERSAAE